MVAVLQPINEGNYIAIDRAVVLIGRAADCDAVITHSRKISRKHCCLIQVDETYYVRDLGSMNGVWLNGDRVKRESLLSLGDHLAIGDVEFRFHPNAKVEDKKGIALNQDASREPGRDDHTEAPEAVALEKSDVSESDVIILDAELVNTTDPPTEDHLPEDQVEIVDDLVLLDDSLNETNEVEAVDPEIADDDLPVLNFEDSQDELRFHDP